MLPSQLTPDLFVRYPPQARALAIEQLDLLRQMPLAFLPLLLREVVGFDWKFPAEQNELRGQFRWLHSLTPGQLSSRMSPFAQLRLSPELEQVDWVNSPASFSEQLSAHLWSTHQIDPFSKASVAYVEKLNEANPPQKPDTPRLTMVVLGVGVTENRYRLFRKLRPHGTYFNAVEPGSGRELFVQKVAARASTESERFSHWYVDGAQISSASTPQVAQISYRSLDGVRDRLVAKMRQTMQPGGGGPEALRSMMARLSPQEIGLGGRDDVLNRFQVSILTEGSGTQLFSTTFVQWTAREILRRAQPITLLTCYAPRQKEQSMQEMLSGAPHQTTLDAQGSLIDADMGAYYTWINQQRLPGAADSSFLAWFEGHRELIAIGPKFARAHADRAPVPLQKILERV